MKINALAQIFIYSLLPLSAGALPKLEVYDASFSTPRRLVLKLNNPDACAYYLSAAALNFVPFITVLESGGRTFELPENVSDRDRCSLRILPKSYVLFEVTTEGVLENGEFSVYTWTYTDASCKNAIYTNSVNYSIAKSLVQIGPILRNANRTNGGK